MLLSRPKSKTNLNILYKYKTRTQINRTHNSDSNDITHISLLQLIIKICNVGKFPTQVTFSYGPTLSPSDSTQDCIPHDQECVHSVFLLIGLLIINSSFTLVHLRLCLMIACPDSKNSLGFCQIRSCVHTPCVTGNECVFNSYVMFCNVLFGDFERYIRSPDFRYKPN